MEFSKNVTKSKRENGAENFMIMGKDSQTVSAFSVVLGKIKYFSYFWKNRYNRLKLSFRILANFGSLFSCSRAKAEEISRGKKL